MRHQQAINQCVEPISLGDDDARVLTLFVTSELGFQQLCRATHAPQRVLDFMRKVAQQLAVFLSKPDLTLFAVALQLLFAPGDFDYKRNIKDELYIRNNMHNKRITYHPSILNDLFSLPISVDLR